MRGELKNKVTRGVAWGIGEKVSTALVQMGVRILVLRLLMPDDLGVVAILMAFASFAQVIVDSGFSQTLIRKAEPRPEDYKSVFVFNLAAAALLYVLLVGVSPLIASYYDMPAIGEVAPVFFLLLPANALCVIQITLFTRQFRFALMSKVTFAASLVGGFTAILMALAGCGVWSIVAQQVVTMMVRAAMLWWLSDWRPRARWDRRAIAAMAPYSFSLLATDFISALYNKIPQLFIGKIYNAETIGYFDQAQKLKDLPVSSAMLSVQGVTFPALSKIADNAPKFAESYRQVLLLVAYAMFPIMLGMSAIAEEMFAVLLGAKWMPTVPFFRTVCLAGLFTPLAMIAYNVLKVKGSGGLVVRLEVAKKIVMTILFALTIPQGVQAVVWGLVAIAFSEMAVNVGASLRFTALTLGRLIRTLLPVLLTAGAMYAAVRGVGLLLPDNAVLRLAVEIATGVAVYAGISALFRLEAYREVVGIVRSQLRRNS